MKVYVIECGSCGARFTLPNAEPFTLDKDRFCICCGGRVPEDVRRAVSVMEAIGRSGCGWKARFVYPDAKELTALAFPEGSVR
jgi:hypothetical protein